MLFYRKKKQERKKQSKNQLVACRKYLKAVGKQWIKVPVLSYCLVYFENTDSRENEPQPYICWSSSVCESSLASQKVVGNVQHGIGH